MVLQLKIVGAEVGTTVGVGVGTTVGVAVGAGDRVGAGVGANVRVGANEVFLQMDPPHLIYHQIFLL